MEKLINALLKDENGISEEAYNALVDHLTPLSYCPIGAEKSYPESVDAKKALALLKCADATDGRFYQS